MRIGVLGIVAVLCVGTFACAERTTTAEQAGQQKSANTAQAEINYASDEEHIEARHAARWKAALAADYDTVWEFATPEYRAIYSKSHLHNQYGARVQRKNPRINKIVIDEATGVANVSTLIDVIILIESTGSLIEQVAEIEEKWKKTDGQWYFIEPK